MSTANTCEPVIKIVMTNEPKWLSRGNSPGSQAHAKRQRGSEIGLNATASWTSNPSVDSRCLTSHILQLRNVETPYAPRPREDADEWGSREANRTACGLGMSEEAKATL